MSKILTEQETQKLMEFLGAGVDFNGGQLLEAVQQWVSTDNEKEVLSKNIGQIGFNADRKEFRIYNPNTGNVETLLSSAVILQAIEEARNSADAVSEKAVVDYVGNYVAKELSEKLAGVYDSQGTISDGMTEYPAIVEADLGQRIAVWVSTKNITVKDIQLNAGDWLTYSKNDGWGKITHTENKATTADFGIVKLAEKFDKADAVGVLTAPLVAEFVDSIVGELEGLISALTTRVTATETGLSALGDRMNTAESNINSNADAIKGLEGDVSALNDSQKAQDEKIGSLEAEQTAQDTKISALETSQATQDTAIADNKSAIDGVKSDVEKANAEISALNDGQIAQDVKIDANATGVANNASEIVKTKEEFEASQKAQDEAVEASQKAQDDKIAGLETSVANAQSTADEASNQANENADAIKVLQSKDDYKLLGVGLTASNSVFTYGSKEANLPLEDIGSFHVENSFGARAMDGITIDRVKKTVSVDIAFPISAGNYTLIVAGQSL